MSKYDRWNRCDHCGQFISVADFVNAKASRILITPDAEGTRETYETTCRQCNSALIHTHS